MYRNAFPVIAREHNSLSPSGNKPQKFYIVSLLRDISQATSFHCLTIHFPNIHFCTLVFQLVDLQ
jgi:hypothetical protein